MEDKEKFLNVCDINDLMDCIKESKMAVENELEDLVALKTELRALNKETRGDAVKLEKKLNYVQYKLGKQASFIQEQEALLEYPELLAADSVPGGEYKKMKDMDYGWKGVMKSVYKKKLLLKDRDTNKDQIFQEKLLEEGIHEGQIQLRNEFKQLRGDIGIKRTAIEEALEVDH